MDTEDYLVLTFRTDLRKIVSIRVPSARRNLLQNVIRATMNNFREVNILEPTRGNIAQLESAAIYLVERTNMI